jgi:chemotaxis protein methyltransferase CheR
VRIVADLAALIEEFSGHKFDDRELARLRTEAERRARICGRLDLADYVTWLCGHRDDPEWLQLLSRVTISESYLFRAPQQLRAIVEVVIPELMARRRAGEELRLWSAGCAKGEEAITLAVVLTEVEALRSRNWSVLGTDVDESALDEAREGNYGRRAMSRVPPTLADRHFERKGDRFRVRPHILQRVSYRRLNLMEQPLGLPPHSFDIVLLRNVLIYFALDTQRIVVQSVASTLARDGSLFLGPSESLRTVPSPLVSHHFEDCFCYRWPPDRPAPVARPAVEATVQQDGQLSVPTIVEDVVGQLVGLREAGDLARAREVIGVAVDRSPEDALLRGIQGWICDQSGDHSTAVACYRAALYLEPSLQQVRFLIANCLWRLGRHERARHEFRTVMSALSIGRVVSVEGFERLGAPAICDLEARCRDALAPETTS